MAYNYSALIDRIIRKNKLEDNVPDDKVDQAKALAHKLEGGGTLTEYEQNDIESTYELYVEPLP